MSGLSRRQALAGLGSVTLGALVAACSEDDDGPKASSSSGDRAAGFDRGAHCTQTAELTEGPFYFEVDKVRTDIREDRKGAPLQLGIRVRTAPECDPIKDAVVDVWHCDAEGSYSERGETYLRGLQVTDGDGIVEFTTIYPGWYPGRTVHIHAKVHLDKRTVLTTQLYFDDHVSARVFLDDPYPGESNRDGFNSTDPLYRRELELTLSRKGERYRGLITLDVARAQSPAIQTRQDVPRLTSRAARRKRQRETRPRFGPSTTSPAPRSFATCTSAFAGRGLATRRCSTRMPKAAARFAVARTAS
jgi:protocatechuate 3,4-dioxygenase beta subunit